MNQAHKKALIVAGGDLACDELKKSYRPNDLLIAADAGIFALLEMGLRPDVVIGDFDTTGRDQLSMWRNMGIQIVELAPEKDVTDTHAALEYAIEQGIEEVILFAVLGGARVDHTLANIQLLEWCKEQRVKAIIVHQHNRLRLIDSGEKIQIPRSTYQYLSLLPVSKEVTGITTKGLRYPLQEETLFRGYTRGISNEWIEEEATISILTGRCLILESNDGKNVSMF